MKERIRVCRLGDIAEGGSRVIDVGRKEVAVFFSGGNYYAIDDRCPHAGASLSGGCIEGEIVTCPWHYWRFRLTDGTWADNPRVKTGSYVVEIDEGDVFVIVPTPPAN